MLLRSSRQKRSSSAASKYKSTPLQQKDVNIMHHFRAEIKNRKNVLQQKGRGKENKKVKIGENFPFETVKFKNIENNSRKKIQEDFEEEKLLNKYSNAGVIRQEIQTFRESTFSLNINPNKLMSNQSQWKKWPIKKQREFGGKFKSAIAKIFKGLDIFDRGVITETNINKWIPEEALYFLGNIFQKIREERLNLSFQAFLKQCESILEQSSEQDLNQFLLSVNGKDYKETVSIDSSQGSDKKEKQSQVELRITKDYKMETYTKNSYKPLIPFDQLNNKFQQDETFLNKQKNEEKQKYDFNYKQKMNPSNNQLIKENNFPKQFIGESSKKQNQVEPDLPYFNFKIPQIPKATQRAQNNFFDLTFKQTEGFKPKSSRIVHQNVPTPRDPAVNNVNPITERQSLIQSDRIDRLSSKLQEYIKFNKAKIERNKKFIRENSVPKASF